MSLKIANAHGNVEVGQGVPRGYVHVRGQRLQPLCRRLNILFAPAVVGFKGTKRYGYSPRFDGVVVTAKSAPKLLRAIEEREANTKAKKRSEERAAEADRQFREQCSLVGVEPYSRTAARLRRGEIDTDEAELIAFKTRYRHKYTDYDDCFHEGEFATLRASGLSPDEAREEIVASAREDKQERPIPATWPEYLTCYDFDSAVAEALARTLSDPQKCHPTWLKEAEIAVRRAGLSLDSLTYEAIRNAIATWRYERQPDEGWA